MDRQAGPDDTLNTPDDKLYTLDNFQRQVIIRNLASNLREIRVIVRYTVGSLTRQYQLTAYISPYAQKEFRICVWSGDLQFHL